MLLPVAPVFAEDAELPLPAATLTPEEWAKQSMGEDSPLSIEVVPYDELPPVVEGQHHYLLLCIDQWVRDARPDGINVPTYANGSRKDMYGNTDGIVLLTLDTRAHRIMTTVLKRSARSSASISAYGLRNTFFSPLSRLPILWTISAVWILN